MPEQDIPFWRLPMRVMDLALEDSHGSWLNRWTPEQIVEIAVRLNANVLNMMVVNEWGQAYWPSPHLPMQPELNGEDRLGAVIEQARQAGLHTSVMWGPTAAPVQADRHPDWASRTRDGKKLGWGFRTDEKCFMLCMNSPFEELVNEVADQLFRDYEIDLLALDFYHQEPCWCEYCRERCLKETGVDINSDREPYGRENIHRDWHKQRVDGQVLRLSQTVKKHGSAIVHYRVVPGTDIVFNEPHTGDMLDLREKGFMIRSHQADARATGKPDVICTTYANQYAIGWSKPPAQMRQEFRTIGLHGSNPWPVMWDWEILRDPRGLEPLGTVFGEMKAIAPRMARAKPLQHVALVLSHRRPVSELDRPLQEHRDALKGFYDALASSHIPFEIIREDTITKERLQGYSTLILPNVTCMSDEQIEAVRHFVNEGGHLVATFETSRFTAEGWKRYEFGLSDVLGVRYLDVFETPWCYITPQLEHPVLSHLDGGLSVPHGDIWNLRRALAEQGDEVPIVDEIKAGKATNTGHHLKIETLPEAQAIAGVTDVHKHLGSYFIKDIVPPIPGKDTGYPSIVINSYGKGSSIYFAGQPDRLFYRQGHPDYEDMLVRSVEWSSEPPEVKVKAPNTIEATYWTLDDGSALIHLMNHTYPAMFPAPSTCEKAPVSREVFRPVRQVIPVHDIQLSITKTVASAEILIGQGELRTEDNTVMLNRLDEYAVVQLQLRP